MWQYRMTPSRGDGSRAESSTLLHRTLVSLVDLLREFKTRCTFNLFLCVSKARSSKS
jgi:hypothetical protein